MEINKPSLQERFPLQNNHWNFTYKQWGFDEKHYIDVIEYLNEKRITSYIDLGANSGGVCSILLERIKTLEKCYLAGLRIISIFQTARNLGFLFRTQRSDQKMLSIYKK